MREKERADKLTQAIEEIIQGRLPADLGDEELNDLLSIARIRLDAARTAAQVGAEEQEALWERIVTRISELKRHQSGEPNGTANAIDPAGDLAADENPGRREIRDLQGIVALRRQMAEEMALLAEVHREAVWQRIQMRLYSLQGRRGLFPFHRRHPEADVVAHAVDRLVQGEPVWETGDPRLEELVRLARLRRALGQLTGAPGDHQSRVWARLRPRLMAQVMGASGGRRRSLPAVTWRHVAAGATAAVLAAALIPLPVSGLEGHPAARFAHFLGEQVGITETSSPPALPPPTQVVEGVEIAADEASLLMGITIRQPTELPPGFTLVAARHFSVGITADTGGVYMLAYQGPEAGGGEPDLILIYQERATGNTIAVQEGSTTAFLLPDGTIATYVEGTWQPAGGQAVWGDDGAQTLLFDRDGVRTIIHHLGAQPLPTPELLAIAQSMLPPAAD